MKKVLIALLAILLLVSFTSCDTQKKIDDAVAEAEAKAAAKETATADFVETFETAMGYFNLVQNYKGSYDLKKCDFTDKSDKTEEVKKINGVILMLLGCKYDEKWEDATLTEVKASGTVEITEKDNTYVLNAKDVKISCKKNSKSYSVNLNGEMKYKSTTDDTKNTTSEIEVVSLTLDETTYKPITTILYTVSGKKYPTFTSAICSGIELNCDIINRLIDFSHL